MDVQLEIFKLSHEIVKSSRLGFKENTDMEIQIIKESSANEIRFLWMQHRLELAEYKAKLGIEYGMSQHKRLSAGDA